MIHKSPHGYLNKYPSDMRVHSRLYLIWSDMRKRCNNPGTTNYYKYGAKGITVCDEWNDGYEPFLIWSLANGYKKHLTIDRIDNSKGYSPENCRWATILEQARNKTSVKFYTLNGFTGCITDWSRKTGIKRTTINQRINQYGWTFEKAVTEGVRLWP